MSNAAGVLLPGNVTRVEPNIVPRYGEHRILVAEAAAGREIAKEKEADHWLDMKFISP